MTTLIDAPDGAVAEVGAYLRLASADEDVLIGRLIAAAIGLAERFTGTTLLSAPREAVLPAACGAWQRLPATPVTAIAGVAADGTGVALDHESDIDAAGDGWVRVTDAGGAGGAARVRVAYVAGLAAGWGDLPAGLRQGVARLVAHLHAHRDAADDRGPPAAVAALWQPWRRMRLS